MTLAFIALGSNMTPEENLPRAVMAMSDVGEILDVSPVYASPAIDWTGAVDESAPPFLNAAVLVETGYHPLVLRRVLRGIEAEMGRVRSADKYAPRTIDLDLVLFGHEVIEMDGVTIPDPDIMKRVFVAQPLADLAPMYRHPLTGESLAEIAARLPRNGMRPRADMALGEDAVNVLSRVR